MAKTADTITIGKGDFIKETSTYHFREGAQIPEDFTVEDGEALTTFFWVWGTFKEDLGAYGKPAKVVLSYGEPSKKSGALLDVHVSKKDYLGNKPANEKVIFPKRMESELYEGDITVDHEYSLVEADDPAIANLYFYYFAGEYHQAGQPEPSLQD